MLVLSPTARFADVSPQGAPRDSACASAIGQGRRMPSPPLTPDPSLLVRSTFDDTAVRRGCLRGDLVRLTAGRYLRRSDWSALDPAARHAMTAIAAVSCLRSPVVVSHASAAAFWGLPRLGPWPARTHVVDPALSTGKSGRFVLTTRAPHRRRIVERYGVPVTTPARTAAGSGAVRAVPASGGRPRPRLSRRARYYRRTPCATGHAANDAGSRRRPEPRSSSRRARRTGPANR